MMVPETEDFQLLQRRVIELAIRLGALLILLLWCFTIISPFVMIVAWGAIVAIALHGTSRSVARL